MKQKNTIILTVLIAIILIVGAIVIATKGLAFELKYQDSQKVELNIGKEFKTEDVKQITNEVFDNQPVKIQAIEVYKDAISITTTEISEEQKTNLVNKINEKYETELKSEDITIESIPHTRGRDIIKPYITPFIIITIIILVYLMIRYYKLNSLKVLIESIGIIALSQMVLLGIMAITRMPIGEFTIPMVLLVYMISTYICTAKFENK
ncbi:protein translocase subunit SecF [Clostridium sp. CAG:575]|nr:protein translocase subunit SecF [Clostridium sp. CAG:575]